MRAIRLRRSAKLESGMVSSEGRTQCFRALVLVVLVLMAGLAGLRSMGSGRVLAESGGLNILFLPVILRPRIAGTTRSSPTAIRYISVTPEYPWTLTPLPNETDFVTPVRLTHTPGPSETFVPVLTARPSKTAWPSETLDPNLTQTVTPEGTVTPLPPPTDELGVVTVTPKPDDTATPTSTSSATPVPTEASGPRVFMPFLVSMRRLPTPRTLSAATPTKPTTSPPLESPYERRLPHRQQALVLLQRLAGRRVEPSRLP
jgi:hypothetical protein